MSARDDGYTLVVFIAGTLFLVVMLVVYAARTISCDESSCPHGGEPRMMRGTWQNECVCVEKPVRP